MDGKILSFLEAIRRGSGFVDADYAGWLVPRDQLELAIIEGSGASRVRLAGWVRDDLSDQIADLISKSGSAKNRDRLAELARYYLRPHGSKDPVASRVTLSNWRHDAAGYVADRLAAPHSTGLTLYMPGLPRKDERLGLDSLARDPAVNWIVRLAPQERDIAIHRGLADAAHEARAKGDARTLIGVALIAARIAPETNPEPTHDYDGVPLRGRDGRKFTRSRLALPLVLLCLHRAAALAPVAGRPVDPRAALMVGHRLVEVAAGPPTNPGPISSLDEESRFDHDLLVEGIEYAWRMVSTIDAKPIAAALTRYAALASGMLTPAEHQNLALLSVAVARRHSDRRALDIDLHHPSFRSDTAESILFQLRFRRERLMLASHHNPGLDWSPELTRMTDLLAVRKRLLPAVDARHMEKVQLHLAQGTYLRQARELTAAGQPMDTVPARLTAEQIVGTVRAIDAMITSMRHSFRIAQEDADPIAAVNAHRRKTEADGVLHLLSRVRHPDALAGARQLRRDLNRLEEIHSDQFSGIRPDVAALWLLAMADQAVRHNELEQARHYLIAALAELPTGIPHLAIRAASIAASIDDASLAAQLLEQVPPSQTWPSYLKHLIARLRSAER